MVKTNRIQLNELQQQIPFINDHAMIGVMKTKELEDQAKRLKTESKLENSDDLIAHIHKLRVCFVQALQKINQFRDVFDTLYAQVAKLDENYKNDDGLASE